MFVPCIELNLNLLKSSLKMMFSFLFNLHKIEWFSHKKMSSIYQDYANYFINKQVWDLNINMAAIMKSCTEGKLTRLSIVLDVIPYYYMYYYIK